MTIGLDIPSPSDIPADIIIILIMSADRGLRITTHFEYVRTMTNHMSGPTAVPMQTHFGTVPIDGSRSVGFKTLKSVFC